MFLTLLKSRENADLVENAELAKKLKDAVESALHSTEPTYISLEYCLS
jgi:hypothetical protein